MNLFFATVRPVLRNSRAPDFEPTIETFMCDFEQNGVSVCGGVEAEHLARAEWQQCYFDLAGEADAKRLGAAA